VPTCGYRGGRPSVVIPRSTAGSMKQTRGAFRTTSRPSIVAPRSTVGSMKQTRGAFRTTARLSCRHHTPRGRRTEGSTAAELSNWAVPAETQELNETLARGMLKIYRCLPPQRERRIGRGHSHDGVSLCQRHSLSANCWVKQGLSHQATSAQG